METAEPRVRQKDQPKERHWAARTEALTVGLREQSKGLRWAVRSGSLLAEPRATRRGRLKDKLKDKLKGLRLGQPMDSR